MLKERDIVDRMRVASPCPMNWEGMKGDNRARFCDLCSLHVYNISELTRKEVNALIARTEGRICARLYKRDDGTVITKDCPVGLRAIRRRVSRVAGAAITAIFSFCVSVIGQSSVQEDKSCPDNAKITIERTQNDRSMVRGVVMDVNGAVMPGVAVTLINQATQSKTETISDKDGAFKFSALEVGSYDLSVQATGFVPLVVTKIEVERFQTANVELQMFVDSEGVTVGIVSMDDQMIDTESPGLRKTFGTKQITSLPF